MYEHHKQPLASRATFLSRILKNILVALVILVICLLIGTAGYHYTAGMDRLDAFHNASMILSGMGLVDQVKTEGGKLFSSCYALFSGVIFYYQYWVDPCSGHAPDLSSVALGGLRERGTLDSSKNTSDFPFTTKLQEEIRGGKKSNPLNFN